MNKDDVNFLIKIALWLMLTSIIISLYEDKMSNEYKYRNMSPCQVYGENYDQEEVDQCYEEYSDIYER